MGEPVFNPFLKEWRNDGKPMHDRYEKPWGYTEYTKDGFAVNYDRNGHEIGRTKGS